MWALKFRVGNVRNRHVLALLCLVGTLLAASTASAYTISGAVRYWDSRDQRSNNTGSRLTQSTIQTNRTIANVPIWLFDMDGLCIDFEPGCSESDDDFLGFKYSTISGHYSFSVTGTQQLYFYSTYGDSSTNNIVWGSDGTQRFITSNPPLTRSASDTINFNITCPDNTKNGALGLCDNQAAVSANFATNQAFANILASMRAGGTYIQQSTGGMAAYFPNGPNNECAGLAGRTLPDGATPFSFCVTSGFNNHTVVHEMGHIMHARKMNITNGEMLVGGACTSGEVWSGEDPAEKCVTAEGFAHFVSAATWWGQNSTTPLYRGNVLESGSCVSSGSTPHRRRGNAARFFFDLYDSTTTNDGGQDNETRSYDQIMNVWAGFAPGTDNRQNRESGANGRNIEDYVANAPWTLGPERDLNCLGDQAN